LARYHWTAGLAKDADVLLRSMNRRTDRIHPRLDSLADPQGHFDCRNPALLTMDDVLKKSIRAAPGHTLMEASFSDLGLRVLAHVSQDRHLCRALSNRKRTVDMDRRTAALALAISEQEGTPRQRVEIGRVINNGVVSWQTSSQLARALIMPEKDAGLYQARFLESYPGVGQFREAQASKVRHVKSFSGRAFRGYIRDLEDGVDAFASVGSFVVLASGVDVFKLAMARLHRELPADCRMLLPAGDAVLLEVPCEQVPRTERLIREVMEERPAGFSIPLRVRIRYGETWAECREPRPLLLDQI
jgi:DNA polymerase-1